MHSWSYQSFSLTAPSLATLHLAPALLQTTSEADGLVLCVPTESVFLLGQQCLLGLHGVHHQLQPRRYVRSIGREGEKEGPSVRNKGLG